MGEKLRNAEDKLAAGEKRKQLLTEEVSAVNQAHLKISGDLEKAKSEAHTLQRQLSRTEKQFMADEMVWKQEIDALKIALDSKDQVCSQMSGLLVELLREFDPRFSHFGINLIL